MNADSISKLTTLIMIAIDLLIKYLRKLTKKRHPKKNTHNHPHTT